MKRRTFIKRMMMGLVGVVAIPKSLMSEPREYERLEYFIKSEHITATEIRKRQAFCAERYRLMWQEDFNMYKSWAKGVCE